VWVKGWANHSLPGVFILGEDLWNTKPQCMGVNRVPIIQDFPIARVKDKNDEKY